LLAASGVLVAFGELAEDATEPNACKLTPVEIESFPTPASPNRYHETVVTSAPPIRVMKNKASATRRLKQIIGEVWLS